MLVARIEHKTLKSGPFRGYTYRAKGQSAHTLAVMMTYEDVTPWDIAPHSYMDWAIGMKDLRSMRKWFRTGHMSLLEQSGYVVRIFRTAHVVEGKDAQVAFPRVAAEQIAEFKPTAIYREPCRRAKRQM
jgi:hypothetical protein